MDGWSYLSRSMQAEVVGDVDSARHLAYYAELRAAMSLLAGIGIGVFNKRHFAVKADRRCERVTGTPGTHAFVWEALQWWGTQTQATDLILRTIQPGGRPLSDWLSHFPPTAGVASRGIIAELWLREWGLDLQRLANDRDARNESSYRPTYITPRKRSTAVQSFRFIEDLWRANEPSTINPFKVLDRYLLRNSLAFAFKRTHAQHFEARQDPAGFARFVEPVFHNMLPTPGDLSEKKWRRLLNFVRPVADLSLLVHSSKTDAVGSSTHHMQVVARAAVLLRVATGATREIVKGVSASDLAALSFWWKPIGEERGLWANGVTPPRLIDLWQDIDNSLLRLNQWRRAGPVSKRNMIQGIADAAHWLSSFERVALWGLGL
jgi:hypothetical protein